jgi:aspartate aminotransferase
MFYERLTAAGVQMHLPTAGFYCYLDFSPLAQVLAEKRGITTSYDLCNDLLSRSCIAVLPGTAFGAPAELLTARLAYVDFNGRNALAASKEIDVNKSLDEAFLVKHCPKLVEGCKRIAEYCASVK